MDGVFLALGQMISKGKVQAEELRGQLGERLPGAFDMAAKAMGVTTAKLDDMLKKGQVTAEEMLPKLAKVLHDDFAVAAAEASQGLQGQLNRLSTEWTRFQASLLNGDAAAKVMKQLASGMKVLADHGAEIASIVGKGIQWAVWTAGVYAAIKALSGLRAAVTAAKAALVAFNVSSVAAAVGSLSGLLGPAGLAAAVGAAAVAFTSLSGSTQSTDEIFQKHQATIDAYKKRMGEAQKSVESFSEAQRKAYKESLELQSEALKNDIAEALKGMNKGLSGIGSINFGNNFFQTDSRQLGVYRAQLEGINNQLLELGKNVTRQDLDIWKSKVMACAEQVRGNGLATKEWTDFIIQLVGAGDSFYIKLAAMIDKGVSLEEALRQLERQTDATKTTLATGWALNVDDVTKGIATMEKSIRGMQAEMLGFKSSKALVDLLPGLSPEEIKEAKDAFGKNGLEGALRAVGDAANDWGVAQRLAFNDLLETGNALDDQEKKLDAWRKKHSGKASAIEQTSTKLETLRKEVAALEEANIPVAKSFDQIVAKLELERKNAVAAAEETAKLSVQRKQATATQATEQKALEIRKAELVYTQKLREAEAKRDDDLKKNADLRLDFEKRYADMVGLSSEAVSKSISKQAEEYRKAIEAGENAAEELVRLEEWKRDQIQRASREAMDGAQVALRDYQVEASNQAKSMNDAFRGLFSGMDSGWKSAWEQMIETGKVSLSSFRSAFASFLADLMHMAITRPITVQIAGVVSGMLGTGGVAYAAGGSGGGGGIGNLSGLSNLMPGSWFSGIGDTINNTMAGWFPSLFSSSSGYMEAAGTELLKAGITGTAPSAAPAPGTFLSTVSPYLMAGGLGSLGYSMLGGALGLPQSKYSGLTAGLGAAGGFGLGSLAAGSSIMAGTSLATGAALGSVVPVVGTVLGAIGGGLLGSLFGGGRRTHASVYGKMEDVGFSRDQQTYIDAFMGGAWYDRAGKKEAEPFAQGIAQVASQTAGSLLDLAGALPEQIRQNALSGLETSTWSAGRGVSDASWNFQWWKEGMAEDMRNQMTAVAQQVFSNAGISQFFDTFDVTTDEGLQKASTALSAISAVRSATDAIKSPLSELEQQAQSAKAQLDAWTQGMKDSGVNAQYAAGLINEYRNAFINDYIKTLDESLHPLSAYAQAVKAANEAVDQRKKALEIIGATEGQLAQVEAMRAEVVKQATEEMLRSFDQSVEQRWAAVNGNGDEVGRSISQANELRETIRQFGEGSAQVSELMKLHAAETAKAAQEMLRSFEQSVAQRWATVNGNADEVNRAISQENELRDTILKFGESSAQVAELLKLHAAETAKAAQDAAKSEYDSLKAQMDALEQQRVQLQQQAIQEQINAINEQLSAAKTLKSTWEGLDKSLGQSRYNLFAGSANLDAENRLGTVQAEFRRLSGLALGGDSDAAGQLAGVGTSLLDIVKQTAGTEEEYLDAFWAVNAQLKSAQDAAGAQVSAADKQLEALQGQLDVQNAALAELQGQSATLEEIEKQIADLKPLLDAAGQKAGVKAFARGGLAMPGWAVVGEEGPELVNFSQPGRVYTAADTAALFRSVTPRAADTDSGSDAEVKALRREVYQLRRDMLISMSEIARFSRRTSDMVEAWDAEGMPGVRA